MLECHLASSLDDILVDFHCVFRFLVRLNSHPVGKPLQIHGFEVCRHGKVKVEGIELFPYLIVQGYLNFRVDHVNFHSSLSRGSLNLVALVFTVIELFNDDYQVITALHSDTVSEASVIACVKVSSLHTGFGNTNRYIDGCIEGNGENEG